METDSAGLSFHKAARDLKFELVLDSQQTRSLSSSDGPIDESQEVQQSVCGKQGTIEKRAQQDLVVLHEAPRTARSALQERELYSETDL